MKERLDSVLRGTIILYGLLYIASLIAVSLEFDGGVWSLIYDLTFSGCEYGPDFYTKCSSNNISLMIWAGLLVLRFIIFGKTYQK